MNKTILNVAIYSGLLFSSSFGQDISLKSGWNLVGSNQNNININTSISTAKTVWKYNDNNWKATSPNGDYTNAINSSSIDTFSTVNAGDGFWINIDQDTNVTLSGDTPSDTTLNLKSGWNLVSLKGNSDVNVSEYITDNLIQTVWKYSNGSWQAYSPDATITSTISDSGITPLTTLNVGDGFWINSNTDLNISNNISDNSNYVTNDIETQINETNVSLTFAQTLFQGNGNSNLDSDTEKIGIASGFSHGDRFGKSIALSNKYMVIGAPGEDYGRGNVYIYKKQNDNSFAFISKIKATYGMPREKFGYSISISGDYIVIGAPLEGSNLRDELGNLLSYQAYDIGAAYIFKVNENNTTSQLAKIDAGTGETAVNDYFGYSVSMSGDYIVAGTPNKDDLYTDNVGSVYVFKKQIDDTFLKIAKVTPDKEEYSYFGNSVNIHNNHFVVGARGANSAYYYKIEDDNVSQIAKIQSDSNNNPEFGKSVSINDDYIAIGKPGSDINQQGSVFVFKREDDNLTQIAKIKADDGSYHFGNTVDMDENYLVVGAGKNEITGSMYMYKIEDNNSITYLTKQDINDSQDKLYFSNSVSINNGYVALTSYNTQEDTDTGKINLYYSSDIVTSDINETISEENSNSGLSNQVSQLDEYIKQYPGHTSGRYQNQYAFAALKSDGSVVTWNLDSSSVSAELSSDVVKVFSNESTFAALKSDGSVITWGDSSYGGDSSSVSSQISSNVVNIFSTKQSFAALKTDGSVVTWGNSTDSWGNSGADGGDSSSVNSQLSSNVINIFSTESAFAALKSDGSVITWGNSSYGGDSSSVSSELSSDVVNIFSTESAFAALKTDGSVITWGDSSYGGDSSSVSSELSSNVINIFSTMYAFAALKSDGSVITWGDSGYNGLYNYGGDSSSVSYHISSNVVNIFSSNYAFAALKSDGSVITWGYGDAGDSSSVNSYITDGVEKVFSNKNAFAALKSDGSVITWGNSSYGGDSSSVSSQISSNVVNLFSTELAFAALKSDGSVITWGASWTGGDSSSVSSELSSDVVNVFSIKDAFAALKSDGSVITWGNSFSAGDSSSVSSSLSSGVECISNIYNLCSD